MIILNINSYYYSSTVHRELHHELNNQKLNSITYVPLAKGYIPREECQYGNEKNVRISECYNKNDRYFFYIKHKKILSDIEKNFKIENFDVMHAHSLFSNGYIAMKLKEKYNIPYIVAVRDTDLNLFFKHLKHLRKLGLKILKEAEKIIFLSEPYRDYLIDSYIPEDLRDMISIKSIVIPNGINKFWHKNVGINKHINKKQKLKLLYVGAISKRKNISSTIKAIQVLRDKGYEIEYTVVGKIVDKHLFDSFKDLEFIKYVEPVSKEKLIEIYRDNDIFVMPSLTETFGLVYAEAVSQGLPVIYSKGQGFDGHFEEGAVGYSVSCFDYKDIADNIIRIVNNYEEISNNCINLFEKFNWDRIALEYTELYLGLIKPLN